MKFAAKLSNGMTLTSEFISEASAKHAASKMIEEYAAVGVSVVSLFFSKVLA